MKTADFSHSENYKIHFLNVRLAGVYRHFKKKQAQKVREVNLEGNVHLIYYSIMLII